MNCSFKEATRRFKPGDKFIVNDSASLNNNIANPGDILVLRFIYISGNSWGIRYDFDGVPPNPEIADEKFILSKYIEPLLTQREEEGEFGS